MKKGKRKFFLTAFGAHIPSSPKCLQEQNVYPVAIRTEDGFDLDASSLLVCEQLIIDRTALEHVKSRSSRHLAPMMGTIQALLDEGLLIVKDYSEIAAKNSEFIRSTAEMLANEPVAWIDYARKHWAVYSAEIPELIRRYQRHVKIDSSLEKLQFGVYCYLCSHPGAIKDINLLNKFLISRKRKFSVGELELLREIIKPMIEYVVLNQILSKEMNSAFLDWSDLGPLYEKSLRIALNRESLNEQQIVSGVRRLFSVGMPELRPSSPKQLVRFLKTNKAITSLRSEISTAINSNNDIDQKWATQIRNDANRLQMSSRKRQRKFSFMGSLLGLIPGGSLIAPGLLGDAIFNLSVDGACDVASSGGSFRNLDKLKWYFTLLEAKS
jgi:hypothetical protein